ncbi:MAG: TonB-dependent receptor [Chitinophagaceae bacterium]|nr:TonB-dependent receptor [Chitinophagaceae bacterium]
MRKIHLSLVAVLTSASVYGQLVKIAPPEDTSKTKELDEVVITGQYKPQSVKNSVYQVKVIGKERILKQGATRLQDVLKNELNIRFSQDVATGGSAISMLGLSGQNVKILMDGLPVTGRQGVNNEFDISQIDINSIERIEIVEGPMSVIYGADALAGVINIITRKAAAYNLSVNARIHEETVGNEYGINQGIHNQQAGLTWKKNKWEIGGSFAHNYFGGWKDTAIERELVWHKKDQLIMNGFIGYTNGKLNLRYRVDGLDEVITNPGNFSPFADPISGDTLAFDQEYLSQRLMHQLQGSYFVNSSLSFQLQSSFTDYSRQVFSTTINKKNGDIRLDPGEGRQSVVDFTGFTFRGTALYKLSDVFSFQPGVDINLDKGLGERLKSGSNAVNDYALFLTTEITPSSKINIRPGLRFIRNSVYDAPPVIPSINTKFQLTQSLDLRLSYARGFRSPSLRELYFSFFDANHQVVGNPDLKAETSHSFTGSLSFKKKRVEELQYSVQLGGYYNDVKNMIDYVFTQSSDTARLYNVFSSKTSGANLSTVVTYKKWSFSAGAAYTGFYNEQYETNKDLPALVWSAEANASVGYSIPAIGLDLNLFYKLTGKRPRYVMDGPDVVLSEQDGFHLADFTLNKKLIRSLTLNAGIRNLFDVDRINSSFVQGGIHTSGGLNVATGRSCFASLLFNWNKK